MQSILWRSIINNSEFITQSTRMRQTSNNPFRVFTKKRRRSKTPPWFIERLPLVVYANDFFVFRTGCAFTVLEDTVLALFDFVEQLALLLEEQDVLLLVFVAGLLLVLLLVLLQDVLLHAVSFAPAANNCSHALIQHSFS